MFEHKESWHPWTFSPTVRSFWAEIEMLWSRTPGKLTSNCSQKPLAGKMRHRRGWMLRWELPLAIQTKDVRLTRMLLTDKLVPLLPANNQGKSFVGRQTLSLGFKLAMSCGFLGWACGSWLFPHRPNVLHQFREKWGCCFYWHRSLRY